MFDKTKEIINKLCSDFWHVFYTCEVYDYVTYVEYKDIVKAREIASSWTSIMPLQMIQNEEARLVFSEPKRAHVTPLFVSLHWLRVAARIKFKTLMLV